MTRTRAGPAGFCTSCRAATTATATATGAKGCTRSRRGTASCRARFRWWRGRGKRLAAWWHTKQRACRRNTGAASSSPHGATTWSSGSSCAARGFIRFAVPNRDQRRRGLPTRRHHDRSGWFSVLERLGGQVLSGSRQGSNLADSLEVRTAGRRAPPVAGRCDGTTANCVLCLQT